MTAIVFNAFTENGDDANPATGILRETSTKFDFVGLGRAAEVFVGNNYGANFFSGRAYAEGQFKATSVTGTSNPGKSVVFLFSTDQAFS